MHASCDCRAEHSCRAPRSCGHRRQPCPPSSRDLPATAITAGTTARTAPDRNEARHFLPGSRTAGWHVQGAHLKSAQEHHGHLARKGRRSLPVRSRKYDRAEPEPGSALVHNRARNRNHPLPADAPHGNCLRARPGAWSCRKQLQLLGLGREHRAQVCAVRQH